MPLLMQPLSCVEKAYQFRHFKDSNTGSQIITALIYVPNVFKVNPLTTNILHHIETSQPVPI